MLAVFSTRIIRCIAISKRGCNCADAGAAAEMPVRFTVCRSYSAGELPQIVGSHDESHILPDPDQHHSHGKAVPRNNRRI